MIAQDIIDQATANLLAAAHEYALATAQSHSDADIERRLALRRSRHTRCPACLGCGGTSDERTYYPCYECGETGLNASLRAALERG